MQPVPLLTSSQLPLVSKIYYVCLATHGNNPRCFMMYTPKGWRRKYQALENLCESGHQRPKPQTYYCDCGAKYKQIWGCLVEFNVDGILYYMRAAPPDERTLDMLADMFYKPGMSAAELFNRLPSVPPQSSTFVKMVQDSKDVMMMTDPDFFDSLQVFPWSQIMNSCL